VALGLGLAAGVVGAVLLLLPGDDGGPDPDVRASCGPRGRGGLCTVAGTFW